MNLEKARQELLDISDDACRLTARLRLAEGAVIYAPGQLSGEDFADALAQQLQDLRVGMERLQADIEVARGRLGRSRALRRPGWVGTLARLFELSRVALRRPFACGG